MDPDPRCAICTEDLDVDDELTHSNACEHKFHKVCIVEWSKIQNVCPLCKKKFNLLITRDLNGTIHHSEVNKSLTTHPHTHTHTATTHTHTHANKSINKTHTFSFPVLRLLMRYRRWHTKKT